MTVTKKSVSHPEEVRLIERLRAGDRAAQTELVRRHQSALVRQAFKILQDWDLAEETVQEVWMGAFKNIESFDGRCSLRTWFTRIVINRAKSRRRREVRSLPLSTFVQRISTPGGFGSEGVCDDLAHPMVGVNEITPERLVLEQEARVRFDGALRALPQSLRSVVLLRDLGTASSVEACRVLAINDLTQRIRLCRARATLRKALQEDQPVCA